MDVNRMIPRPPNRKWVKRKQAKLAAKQYQKRGRILTMSNEKEYGFHEGKARAVKRLGLLLGFGDKCSLSSPKIIAAALLFALTLLIPSTIAAGPWFTGINKAIWKDLIKETSTYHFDYWPRRPARSLLNIIEKNQIVCVGCQSVVECHLLAKIIKEVNDLNSAEFSPFRKNLEIRLEADSAVFFPATHLGEIPGDSKSRQRKMSTTDKRFNDRNDLSKNEVSYLILMSTGDSRFHDPTCDTKVLYQTDFFNFEVSVSWLMSTTITASVHVKATNQTVQKCPTNFMVTGYNGKIIYHADQTLWLESDDLNSGLTSLEMLEYRECLWPNYTVVGKNETISPFIPLEIGGPPAATNTIPGYGTQNRGPWLHVPLKVRRGNCPGTEVKIWDKCPPPGPSARSISESGKFIRKWCCIDCSFPPVHFITQGMGEEECWYAEEIRPLDSSLTPVLITVSVKDSVAAKLAATVKCQMEECFSEQKDEL